MKIKHKPGVLLSSCWRNFPISLIFCCLLAVFHGISDVYMQNVLSPHPFVGAISSALWVGLGGCTAVSCLKRRCALPRWTIVAAAVAGVLAGAFFAEKASVVWGLMIISIALCLWGHAERGRTPSAGGRNQLVFRFAWLFDHSLYCLVCLHYSVLFFVFVRCGVQSEIPFRKRSVLFFFSFVCSVRFSGRSACAGRSAST